MKNRLARLIGTPTINPVAFTVGKLSLAFIVVPPLVQLGGFAIAPPLAGFEPIAGVLAVAGVLLLVVGTRSLGSALRVGLPQEETVLKTTGVYRYSRHPIYLSIFLFAIAACLYCPHPVVIAASFIAVVIHHLIALSEERFLERRFGADWLAHRARVPRYLGLPRAAGSRGEE
ncbi:MAG: isoprenylcysteine carboxylmethyltransferase family protein [Thermoanaerobaculia bacterium]